MLITVFRPVGAVSVTDYSELEATHKDPIESNSYKNGLHRDQTRGLGVISIMLKPMEYQHIWGVIQNKGVFPAGSKQHTQAGLKVIRAEMWQNEKKIQFQHNITQRRNAISLLPCL